MLRPIMDTIQLLEYLDANGYICLIDFPENHRVHIYNKDDYLYNVPIPIDHHLISKINKAYNSSIYVNKKLDILVANNFMDFEDLQLHEAKKQTEKASASVTLAIIAVIISALTLLFTIIL